MTRLQRNIKTKALTCERYGIGSSEKLNKKNTIALHSTAHYCTEIHCTALHSRYVHYTSLTYIELNCSLRHNIQVHCMVGVCTILHCTGLQCSAVSMHNCTVGMCAESPFGEFYELLEFQLVALLL